ncbi:PLP-dependent aminotransferase family protein [Maridesulfovibrio zosterae]|uniref:aminotransferase-like domain-containing protein n=1 Tax=Maridesulfovibrio zosterae TaxID=82171 RepID=UPI000401B475|nr:PLP-dependent aminotransferase family protein [Maridesulfovibrio zosterae]
MTKWKPELTNENVPKYKSLADAIERDIFSGKLRPGDKLPTHRDLADDLKINVSTITRGYAEAEKRGLISGTVGRGTYVASDAATYSSMVSFEPYAPGMIELGLANTLYDLDPDINEGMKKLFRRKNINNFLRYTDPNGLPEHREVGVEWIKRYGLNVSPDEVLVCSGSQHALTCSLISLFRPGDKIATDCLTYPGMKTLSAMFGIKLVPIAMDEHGMIPEALDTACRRDRISGVYLIPSAQNPTTVCMPIARREKIAMVVRNHNLIIIEDDAYNLTVENSTPPVAAFAKENSVHIAGISKMFVAGLRVAFISAAKDKCEKLAHGILNTVWMTPSLNAELVCQWIKDGTADKTIKLKRRAAHKRYNGVRDLLEDLDVKGSSTSFFLWLRLPEQWKGYMLESRARKAGINIFCAEKFAVGDTAVPSMARLSLSGTKNIDELRYGLDLLRKIILN